MLKLKFKLSGFVVSRVVLKLFMVIVIGVSVFTGTDEGDTLVEHAKAGKAERKKKLIERNTAFFIIKIYCSLRS